MAQVSGAQRDQGKDQGHLLAQEISLTRTLVPVALTDARRHVKET